MKREDFQNSPGSFASIGTDTWAYVPGKLPPQMTWDPALIQALSAADRALGELAGLGRNLPNPYLFTRPFLNREAVLSSRIEGTQASLTDLYALEAQVPLFIVPDHHHDAIEVRNYVRALEYGLERIKELPISARLLKEIHGYLMDGVRGQNLAPGEFRRVQNWIGPPGATLKDATFVPPPANDLLIESIQSIENFIHVDESLPPLIKIAIIHYQFEATHPFLDGNGRIGRLLITLLMIDWDLLPEPLLYLSAYFERHRDTYYKLLLAVSQKGAWSEWITFFLRGIASEAKDAGKRAKLLLDLRESLRDHYQKDGASPSLLRTIDHLFFRPVITPDQLAAELEVTPRMARNILNQLEGESIIREMSGRKRDRIFVADLIMSTLEEDIEPYDPVRSYKIQTAAPVAEMTQHEEK